MRGTPIARLVLYEETTSPFFGCLKGSIIVKKDIMDPMKEKWDAEIPLIFFRIFLFKEENEKAPNS